MVRLTFEFIVKHLAITSDEYKTVGILSLELEEWFKDNNIKYTFIENNETYFVKFSNPGDALAFKLGWL